ncbi:hypothetical protein [Salidesulfovibrio brasiliensis]
MRLEIPKPKGDSPRERIIRGIALVLVIVAVGWAFMENNKNVLDKIQTDRAINDQTKRLTDDDMEFLKGFVQSLRDSYGVNTRIVIYKDEVLLPEIDPKYMFIGLAPAKRDVILHFPTLMRPALGQEFIDSLNEVFLESYEKDSWPRELKIVLTMIWSRLSALEAGQQDIQ